MDTALPKSERASKILVRVKNGHRYYKRGGYVCDFCPYSDNKTCSMCVFANFNVHGVKAGFSPKEAYRRAHKDDLSNSPLMQKLKQSTPLDRGLPSNQVLPKVHMPFFPVPSFNSMNQSLQKLQQARRHLG